MGVTVRIRRRKSSGVGGTSRRWLIVFGLAALVQSASPARLLVAAQLGEKDPRNLFFERLSELCGAEYVGKSSFPDDPEDSFYGERLVAKITSCTEREIRIPFEVGEDHSRTWLITRGQEGLRLRHDHRHHDGTPDDITLYGGWATTQGSGRSQSFAADAYTRELIPAAATNVWTISFDSEGRLTYYLERHGKPRFKATLARVRN